MPGLEYTLFHMHIIDIVSLIGLYFYVLFLQ